MSDQQYVMPITSKGQVTIPAAVRQLLGLKKSGKVAFKIKGSTVTVESAQATLQAAYGAVTPFVLAGRFRADQRDCPGRTGVTRRSAGGVTPCSSSTPTFFCDS